MTFLKQDFQPDIARNITAVRQDTSHDLIYKETNWLSFSERHALNCMKMSERYSMEYLQSILPDKI